MSWFKRLATRQLTSDVLDVRVGQFVCFASGPAILIIALRALTRLTLSPGEAFLGILLSLTLALLTCLLGLVLPLSFRPTAIPVTAARAPDSGAG